jgi:hypothetical protein
MIKIGQKKIHEAKSNRGKSFKHKMSQKFLFYKKKSYFKNFKTRAVHKTTNLSVPLTEY